MAVAFAGSLLRGPVLGRAWHFEQDDLAQVGRDIHNYMSGLSPEAVKMLMAAAKPGMAIGSIALLMQKGLEREYLIRVQMASGGIPPNSAVNDRQPGSTAGFTPPPAAFDPADIGISAGPKKPAGRTPRNDASTNGFGVNVGHMAQGIVE